MANPSKTKTLTLSPLDIWLLYFTLHQWRPINDRRALLKHFADSLAAHGWNLSDYKMGNWNESVTLNFLPAEGVQIPLHDWQLMVRVKPLAGFAYRALDPNGNPQPILNEEMTKRAVIGVVGVIALVVFVSLASRDGTPKPAAPAPVAQAPAPEPVAPPPEPPPVAAPEPAPAPPTEAAPPPEQTFARPKRVDPTTLPDPVKVTLTGMATEQKIAENVAETRGVRKVAPIIYIETSYLIDNGGNIVTTERWWFNFRDDFVQNDAFDTKDGHSMNARSRILTGNTQKRIDHARQSGSFKLDAKEQWALGKAVPGLVFQKTVAYYRAHGFGPEVIAKILPGKTADEVVMTVTDGWKALPQPERLAKAQELWQQWYVTRYPVGKDYAFLRLVDAKGEKQGGSGPLGAAIYVVP